MTALRLGGIFSIEEVQFAIVETNGSVSVYQKSADQPATKEDVHTAKKDCNPPQVIIADGQLREHALVSIGQNRQWLDLILRNAGISIPEIFMMTADQTCRYQIIKKDQKN